MEPPAAPSIDGYLLKLKHHKPRFSSAWVRRYFKTRTKADGSCDLVYADSPSHAIKKSISLASVTSVVLFDELSFQINLRHTSFLLRCESAAQLACWVPTLQHYLREWSSYAVAQNAVH